jgi:hypothetical protein
VIAAGRGRVLLHQTVKGGLLRAVALVVERGAVQPDPDRIEGSPTIS